MCCVAQVACLVFIMRMLLNSPFHPMVAVPRQSTIDRHMSADIVFCQVFLHLPTGAAPPYKPNICLRTIDISFLSTCPCHHSMHFLSTPSIASSHRILRCSMQDSISFREIIIILIIIIEKRIAIITIMIQYV